MSYYLHYLSCFVHLIIHMIDIMRIVLKLKEKKKQVCSDCSERSMPILLIVSDEKKIFTIVLNSTTLRDIILKGLSQEGSTRYINLLGRYVKKPLVCWTWRFNPPLTEYHPLPRAASERGCTSSYRSRGSLRREISEHTVLRWVVSPGTTMNHIPRKRISV